MKKQKALFISCSEHYNHRFCVVDEYLRSCGYQTTYITSDFDHTTKAPFVSKVPGCVQIPAKPYRKNLSAARILSHMLFARDIFRYLEELPQEPNVIIALLPPNFLGHYLARYKKKHPKVKLVFDIFDMWPETFPSNKLSKLLAPFFTVWAWLRDHNLSAADFVTTECELFRDRLNLTDDKSTTVYLCAEPIKNALESIELREGGLDLCYLGAINNVIGVHEICDLLKELCAHCQVTLHVIGAGERQQEFLDEVKIAGAQVVYYGPIYDDVRKQEIIRNCHFGLNIAKSSACIGLTMKSVDYFRYGLPIINNIPADTQVLLDKYCAGIQLRESCVQELVCMSKQTVLDMRLNVQTLFAEVFDKKVIIEKYHEIFTEIM